MNYVAKNAGIPQQTQYVIRRMPRLCRTPRHFDILDGWQQLLCLCLPGSGVGAVYLLLALLLKRPVQR